MLTLVHRSEERRPEPTPEPPKQRDPELEAKYGPEVRWDTAERYYEGRYR